MALFKIFKGQKDRLPERALSKDGYCYFTIDDALFYVDYKDPNTTDENAIPLRKALNSAAVIETNQGLEQKFWRGTQEQYDEIVEKSNDTLYIITNPNQSSGSIATEIVLLDQVNGKNYSIKMENGRLISTLANGQEAEFSVEDENGDLIGYGFETGMSWRDWVASSYNTGGFKINTWPDTIFTSDGWHYIAEPNENDYLMQVHLDLPIEPKTYKLADYCCFEAGTQILTSLNGQETVPIETLKAGDFVISYNVKTGENYLAKVKEAITNKRSEYMAIVVLDNGTSLTMTDIHPLYTDEGFKSPRKFTYPELKIGDRVKTFEGWSVVESIEKYRNLDAVTTYTLNVIDLDEIVDDSTNDNFYANGVVAHNKC